MRLVFLVIISSFNHFIESLILCLGVLRDPVTGNPQLSACAKFLQGYVFLFFFFLPYFELYENHERKKKCL